MIRKANGGKSLAIPPGETIREQLDIAGMGLDDLAARMGIPVDDVRRLIEGEIDLDDDIARRLEGALGVSAQYWRDLESIYRARLETV